MSKPRTTTAPSVAELRPGMAVEGVFVAKKVVSRAQAGGERFLLFQFSDRSGTINGVQWEAAGEGQVAAGDLVLVEGDVQLYQNARQIRVRRIATVDPSAHDLSAYLPTSRRDLDALYAQLLLQIDAVQEPHLRRLYTALFHDPEFAARYKVAPAGKGWHHAWVGGLLEHVLAMLELGDLLCRQHPRIDRDLLLGGLLLHDVGKLEELRFKSHIEYTDAGRLVGHLVQGCLLVGRAMDAIAGFPPELRTKLLHTIVGHHGSPDRGSPKPPMTLEAMVVHLVDQLDSQAAGVEQVVERGAGADGWSEPVRLLDRAFFIGRGPEDAAGPPASAAD